MHILTEAGAALAVLIAVTGVVQGFAGCVTLRRFLQRHRQAEPAATGPGVTVLKPLYGDEPLLEAALSTACAQNYSPFQVVFGVQNPTDPALMAVARVRQRFPGVDIAVVVDDTATGANRKIANLINMLPAAKHEILVIADSDVHAAPDWLACIVQALQVDGIGLVTTPYVGCIAHDTLAARLGATGITHSFLPGALVARSLGRQDCLGATMALRRDVLNRVGGLPALLPHLADDFMLGWLVRRLGLSVGLAATLPATTVPETTLGALFRHELRWGRTIRTLVPLVFSLSLIEYSCAWALFAVALSGLALWSVALFLAVWLGRAGAAIGIDRLLGKCTTCFTAPAPVWLFPLRDLLSIVVVFASYAGDRVEWRGHVMRTTGVADRAARAT